MPEPNPPRVPRSLRVRIAAVVLILGGALRLVHWGAPLVGDEGFTIRFYARNPYSSIVSTYDAPNNHILLSLLLHGIDESSPKKLLQTLADVRPLQFPSVAASVMALILTYAVACELIGPLAAVAAAAALAVSYWHLIYSHMLRGYSLSVFFVLASVWFALRTLKKSARWACFLPVTLAAAHYLVPVNACYSVALAAWSAFALAERGVERRRQKAAALAAAFAGGAALTYLVYRPVLGQMMEYARRSRASGAVASVWSADAWRDALQVLGRGAAFPAFFALVAACGLADALRRRGRPRRAGVLLAAFLAAPPLFFALQRAAPGPRVYLPSLPFWSMAFALGLYSAAAAARRALKWPRAGFSALVLAASAAAVLVSGGQLRAFWRWNRGVDPRRALLAVAADVRGTDDFVVIADEAGDDVDGDALDWNYYGFASGIYPNFFLMTRQDYSYLIRGRYYVIAPDEAAARAALRRSGVDPFLLKTLSLLLAGGRTKVFKAALNESVLADYRAAASSAPAPLAERVQALAGLGADALRGDRFPQAVSFLERAERLVPEDAKVRYLLGQARYLSFDDEKAGAEFAWVIAHDTANIHAPLYYGDALAGRGRDGEALRAYAYYQGERQDGGFWMFQDRARIAADAVRAGSRPSASAGSDLREVLARANAYYVMGSYERAAVLIRSVARLAPVPCFGNLAAIDDRLDRRADGARALRAAVAAGAVDLKIALAEELKRKHDDDGARLVLESVLAAAPDDPRARALRKAFRRY